MSLWNFKFWIILIKEETKIKGKIIKLFIIYINIINIIIYQKNNNDENNKTIFNWIIIIK